MSHDAMSHDAVKHEEFALANRAFDLFTLAERERTLEEFVKLRYPLLIDRFFEAVHRVIRAKSS